MLSNRAWMKVARDLGITTRELQIVQAVFDNLTEKQIPNRLKITEHTAHTHLNRLFKKLSVTTRAELVLRVIEHLIALTLAKTGVLPPICPHQQSGDCCIHNPAARHRKA